MITKAIKSLRKKNNLSFGYKIIDGNISNETEYNSKVIFLDNNGNETNTRYLTWLEVNNEINIISYKYNRAKEYPRWQDQLDDIYHNGIDGWKATVKVTKDKYPKS